MDKILADIKRGWAYWRTRRRSYLVALLGSTVVPFGILYSGLWATVVVSIAWLVYRDYLQKKRIDDLKSELEKHEDACVLFRRDMYKRVGKVENEVTRIDERTKP